MHYQVKDLGPSNFTLNGLVCCRKDVDPHRLPCVVFCHGNCGSRLDSFDVVYNFLPQGLTVFCFDFAGCGNSDGEFISLGYYESQDIGSIVRCLRQNMRITDICLFGRSMGATSVLHYAATDPKLFCIVLDSAFTSIMEICKEYAASYKVFPRFVVTYCMGKIRSAIQRKLAFDIVEVDSLAAAAKCGMPVCFIHSSDDELVRPHHMDALYEAYKGDKIRLEVTGDHNDSRE